jgi:hypothetical protein
VFMVGDTVSGDAKVEAVVQSAIALTETVVGQD